MTSGMKTELIIEIIFIDFVNERQKINKWHIKE